MLKSPIDIMIDGGPLSRQIDGYRMRKPQVKMAQAVYETMKRKGALVVEAPTGTGKSAAYLIPAALHSLNSTHKNHGKTYKSKGIRSHYTSKGARILVSTGTINLQGQLAKKDLPMVAKAIPGFTYSVAKGRGNYVSKRRMYYQGKQRHTVANDEFLQKVISKSMDGIGSVEQYDFAMQPLWSEIASDSGDCLSSNCAFFEECHYMDAKRGYAEANIVVANHSITLMNAMMQGAVLGDFDCLIVDECHDFVEAARDAFSQRVTTNGLIWMMRILSNKNGKGMLAKSNVGQLTKEALECVDDIKSQTNKVMSGLPIGEITEAIKTRAYISYANSISNLCDLMKQISKSLFGNGKMDEAMAVSGKLRVLQEYSSVIGDLCNEVFDEQFITWVERDEKGNTTINITPVNPSSALQGQLFGEYSSCIFTSATISTNNNFSHWYSTTGYREETTKSMILETPFDYRQTEFRTYDKNMPAPGGKTSERFKAACDKEIKRLCEEGKGGTLVLWTNKKDMEESAPKMAKCMKKAGLKFMVQGAELSRGAIVEEMKADPNCVVYGLRSMWQGIDVPGDHLRCVIIVKIPFAMANTPVEKRIHKDLEDQGKSAFIFRTVPEACIMLKQGIGRLVRRVGDSGKIVLLDNRINTKPYSGMIKKCIPKGCKYYVDDKRTTLAKARKLL